MGSTVYSDLSLAQAGERILCDFYCTLRRSLRQYHREFIASQTPEYIHAANTAEQHMCDHLQKRVTRLVSARIVDIFELIQVEKQQRTRMLVAGGQIQHLFQLFLKAAAII